MKFINIIGTTGSGKSTFARKLAQKQQLQYIELDIYYGWMIGRNQQTMPSFASLNRIWRQLQQVG